MLSVGNMYRIPVGMLCSPGRIQRMGPSLDLLRGEFSRMDLQPHGIVCKRNIQFLEFRTEKKEDSNPRRFGQKRIQILRFRPKEDSDPTLFGQKRIQITED